jgi:hypothetical protein
MPINGVIIVEDEHVPLTSRDPSTGKVRDLLCLKIDGRLHFHPTRLAMVSAALARQDTAIDRWADDGGGA